MSSAALCVYVNVCTVAKIEMLNEITLVTCAFVAPGPLPEGRGRFHYPGYVSTPVDAAIYRSFANVLSGQCKNSGGGKFIALENDVHVLNNLPKSVYTQLDKLTVPFVMLAPSGEFNIFNLSRADALRSNIKWFDEGHIHVWGAGAVYFNTRYACEYVNIVQENIGCVPLDAALNMLPHRVAVVPMAIYNSSGSSTHAKDKTHRHLALRMKRAHRFWQRAQVLKIK